MGSSDGRLVGVIGLVLFGGAVAWLLKSRDDEPAPRAPGAPQPSAPPVTASTPPERINLAAYAEEREPEAAPAVMPPPVMPSPSSATAARVPHPVPTHPNPFLGKTPKGHLAQWDPYRGAWYCPKPIFPKPAAHPEATWDPIQCAWTYPPGWG